MDALTAATATAAAVTQIGSHFMVAGATYQRGAALGFGGLDFYVTGRGGVLGDVDSDVVCAAFLFFEPTGLRAMWDQGRAVMPPAQAAGEFATCCHHWAEEHVPDGLDVARLGDLAGKVISEARPAGAALFAGWRALAVPADPKARAVHQMNALRELRGGLHNATVIAAGLSPLQALSLKSPGMAPLFGWTELAEVDGLAATWDRAEANTNRAIAHAYEGLDETERTEFAELAGALQTATAG